MVKKIKLMPGAIGLDRNYWEQNYSDPASMDCIGNSKEHVQYMKHLFQLEYIDISSVIDFGFGMGLLFQEVIREFKPYLACGIEPSKHMFDIVDTRVNLKFIESMKLKIENLDILTWSEREEKKIPIFDLGICTSVLQYLSDDELERSLPVLAKKVKYLYLTVPTNKELDKQIEELDFFDKYAIRRSRTKYQKLLKKHFTFVAGRILESKIHFNEETTLFNELVFRF